MTETTTLSYSLTVSGADVVWVASQIRAELDQFQFLYPEFLTTSTIEEFTKAIRVFLKNDVISAAEIILGTPFGSNDYLSWDQRVFQFNHAERRGREAFGRHEPARRYVPEEAEAYSFMTFNSRMCQMSRSKQQQVLSGTRWSSCSPGSGTKKISYLDSLERTGVAWSRNLGVERWQ